ncbi:putative Ig domain-containing protein, partial [Klebsiella pneumoniae]|uniref:putative Ig domain-containing protein n=1 Tax=Klebsiella pneumoniae TaxID=573 RepID=UPI002739251D
FQPGETSKVFPVTIIGNLTPEPDENFTVVLSNPVNATIGTGTGTGTIINDDVLLTILPAVLPTPTFGNPYSATLTTNGGTAPYTYTRTSGLFPAGLTLTTDGTLAGTPVVAGNFAFTITSRDSSGASGSQNYTM